MLRKGLLVNKCSLIFSSFDPFTITHKTKQNEFDYKLNYNALHCVFIMTMRAKLDKCLQFENLLSSKYVNEARTW